jgi:flagellar hook-basal body complex protein FliE
MVFFPFVPSKGLFALIVQREEINKNSAWEYFMIDKMGAVSGLLSSAVTDAIKSPSLTSKPQALDQASFADAIAKALESASLSADKTAELGKRLQMDDPTASVEETVIAMNTSSLQFTAVVQARNKILQAYNDIMNMPV